MSRDYGEGRCELPMGNWDTGVSRHCHCGANTRDNLVRDLSISQRLRLFAAATKNDWIAPLEPHDLAAKPGVVNECSVDFFLSDAMAAGLLADKNPRGCRRRLFEEFHVHQLIVNDNLSAVQQLQTADRYQAHIPRPRANEINFACPHDSAPKVFSSNSFA